MFPGSTGGTALKWNAWSVRWVATAWVLGCVVAGAALARAEGPFGGSVTAIAYKEGRPTWVGTERGLFRFSGGRWERVPSWGVRHVTALVAVEGAVLVGWRRNGLWRTPDRGRTWSRVEEGLYTPMGTRVRDVRVLVSHPERPETLYLGSAGQGVFLSTDGGRSWRRLGKGLERAPPPAFHVTAVLPPEGGRPLLMGTDGAGLFRWEGGTWRPVEGLPRGLRVRALAAVPGEPERVLLGSWGWGLWSTRDGGGTWTRVRKGLFGMVESVAAGPLGRWAAQFAGEGLAVSGERRARVVGAWKDAEVRTLLPVGTRGWIAGLAHDGLWRVGPDGRPGDPLNSGLSATVVLSLWRDPDGVVWCGDTNGVFVSEDDGETWVSRDAGLPGAAVTALLRAGPALYAGTRGRGVFRWDPVTSRWQDISQGMGTANTVFSLAWDGERLYAGTEGGVLRRAGREWKRVGTDLPQASRWLVVAHPGRPGHVWAAGDSALFVSTDGGESWEHLLDVQAVALGVRPETVEPWILEADTAWLPARGVLAPLERGEQFTVGAWEGGTFWMGTSQGLWAWRKAAPRRVWTGARVLCVWPEADRVFLGTDGRGVVRLPREP